VRTGGSTAVFCTSALSLARGTGTATAPPRGPLYFPGEAAVFTAHYADGKTWHVVSATLDAAAGHNGAAIQTAAYGLRYPDAKGHLARVCITAKSKRYCTRGW
jgi:hypothetical protein